MGSDQCTTSNYNPSQSASPLSISSQIALTINFFSQDDIHSVYASLSSLGQIKLPLSEQFWGAEVTQFTDKYQINWYLNYQLLKEGEREELRPREITPYLRFAGQCEEAMTEYQRILGGKLILNVQYHND